MTDALEPAVSAHALTLRRGASTVLQDITLSVPSGAVVGLVGRNGAGKSSLLRCLVGLTLPSSGRCELLGAPSAELPDAWRPGAIRAGILTDQ